MSKKKEQLSRAISLVKQIMRKHENTQLIALSGAGISKASGIPTFRGENGLWKDYNPKELATPQAFERDPELVWDWYSWRISLIKNKTPNLAHYALVTLEKAGLLECVLTQNVDSLHQRAGIENIIELHGNIFRARCEKCHKRIHLDHAPKELPICSCGKLLRPDVVWFGESLDSRLLEKSQNVLTNQCDVLLVIGTSGIVYPVASFPKIAKKNNAVILEFNIQQTPISHIADVLIQGKAEKLLPEFVNRLLPDAPSPSELKEEGVKTK